MTPDSFLALTGNPLLSPGTAGALLTEHWGLAGDLTHLGSLQDQNFRLTCPDGSRYVLKVTPSGEAGEQAIVWQHAVLRYLAEHPAGFDSPVPIRTRDGSALVRHDGCDLQLLTWVHGETLGGRGVLSDPDRAGLGAIAARATLALASFGHPDMDRGGVWDIRNAGRVIERLGPRVPEPRARCLVNLATAAYRTATRRGRDLPVQVVHTDITPGNVVRDDRTGAGRSPSGILDFGDVTRTWRVADVVGVASDVAGYGGAGDVLEALAAVVRGYQAVCPLTEAEVELIWPLILARTAVTYLISQEQNLVRTTNEYARDTAAVALGALERLGVVPDCLAVAVLRDCAGFDPCPEAAGTSAWLGAAQRAPLLAGVDAARVSYLDLSVSSESFVGGEWLDDAAASELCADAEFVVSRWGESRLTDARAPEPRSPHNLNLGAEIFSRKPLEVRSPLAAEVHSVSGDGAVIALGRDPARTYLAVSGIVPQPGLRPGTVIEPGRVLGSAEVEPTTGRTRLGVYLRAQPDLPRLGQPVFRAAWLALCPDPSALLGFDARAPRPVPAGQLRDERAEHVARSQHLYYDQPVEIVRGWRHYLYDADGRPYLDMINNIASVGHSHPRITAAATRQFRMLNTNSRFMYRSIAHYSARIAALLPPELDTVFLVNSGSEAADLALLLARTYTGHRDVIALRGAYHGWTGAVIALSSSPQDRPNWEASLDPWIHLAEQPDPYRGRFGADAAAYCASVRAACLHAGAGGGLAAFVSEPLLGNQGAIEPPAGYLDQAYRIVRAAGGVCIADEVQVGMGRTGTDFWAFEHEGVVPDVVYTAKSTGNGHPLGVVACRREIADAFDFRTSYFSSTGGGPVSCEIGLAVLDVIRDEELQRNALDMGNYLKDGLAELAQRHSQIGAVHGRGLYLGIDLVKDRESKAPATALAMRVSEQLRPLGVVMQPTGDAFNLLKVKPPLCIDRAAADYFTAALDTALRAVV